MSAAPHPLALAEAWLRDHRHQLATKLEEAMSHLSDLIENGRTLATERVPLIADRDAERARADAAEKHAADLQARIDADDEAARAAKEELDAEIAKEAGVATKPADPEPEVKPEAPEIEHTPDPAPEAPAPVPVIA